MSGKRVYNLWAGNPKGTPERCDLCIAEVRASWTAWPIYSQCTRKRGYGPDGLYCKQHAKKAKKPEDLV